MALTKITEWEGEHVRLVKLLGLPKGPGKYPARKHPIEHVIAHQSAGNFLRGTKAPFGIAVFHTAPPKYKLDESGNVVYRTVRGKRKPHWIGGGKGWPGAGYTFVVPAVPDAVDGKFEVYRIHDDNVVSWHTGGAYNSRGVAVCFAGTYRTRHDPRNTFARERPDQSALLAGQELILDYLMPRYGLTPSPESLLGHFDAGKAACPGDYLEQWVRHTRGEDVEDPADTKHAQTPMVASGALDTAKARQEALIKLGYDLGQWGADGVWGEASKAALLAFQDWNGLTPSGRWDTETEQAVAYQLANPDHVGAAP